MTPIARMAIKAGHTVAYAGQATIVPVIEAAWFTAIPIDGKILLSTSERLPLLKLDQERLVSF